MKRCKVLIVDDEGVQRELICEVLQTSEGRFDTAFDVLQASNGAEALETMRHHTVNAVLLDKRMPIMDGDELCMNIRSTLGMPLLPILMVTGKIGY